MASQMKNQRAQLKIRSDTGRPATRVVWTIALAALATTPVPESLADRPSVAYQDPAAAAWPEGSVALLSWGPEISVVSIDGSAPDPSTPDRRARLAPGSHAIYFFGTVRAIGKCPAVTGDELAEFAAEAGRNYSITARHTASPDSRPAPGCHIELRVADVTGPEPALGPSQRLARAGELARGRFATELQEIKRAAAAGDLDAAVNLALWYLLGDDSLSSPDPVAAQAWLIAAAERGSRRAESIRAELAPTLSPAQRQAAAERAATPPLPSVAAKETQR